MTDRILDYDKGKKRPFPVLNAIGSMCVSELKGRVVSVDTQIKLEECMVCLNDW